jgi:hypothetical protein
MKNLATFIGFAAIGLLLGFLLHPWGGLDCGGQKPDKIERDTTWVHDTIPYPVPEIIIKYLPAPVDSHVRADSTKWYTATGGKITERGDTVGVMYNSPVRLSPAGFFSSFVVKHAPIWVPIDTVFITTTITKYEQYFSWWSTIALLVVGFVAGALAL